MQCQWVEVRCLISGDIEQAIDNFNNVPNQNADIKIKPGASEGESELIIEVKRSKPWSLFATVDNSGTDETGKVQMTGGFQLSSLFQQMICSM